MDPNAIELLEEKKTNAKPPAFEKLTHSTTRFIAAQA
jgi:hypothetical protein